MPGRGFVRERRAFWASRYQDSCDPFAPSALGVVDERGLGLVTLKWLRAVAGHLGLQIDELEIGHAVVDGHVEYTDADVFGIVHLLLKKQITDYHVAEFAKFGLPGYTFGGAPFGNETVVGRWWERVTGELIWCPDCDKVP